MLDKSKPYSTVYGHSHAKFEQGVKLFNGRGIEIDGSSGKELEEVAAPPANSALDGADTTDDTTADQTNTSDDTDTDDSVVDFSKLPWHELKKRVVALGGTYVSIDQAILYLNNEAGE